MSEPTAPRRTLVSVVLCVVATLLLTWVDLGTKDWALDRLSHVPSVAPGAVCVANAEGITYFQRIPAQPLVLIDGFLELRYAENCGAAFGMLNDGPNWLRLLLFAPAAAAAVLGLLWLFWTGYGGRLFAYSVPLIASGALGNVVDRFRLGYVVDFIRFHVRDAFVYPTFNVADITITIGAGLLLIEGFSSPSRTRAKTAQKASS
jgi:signal peptidase II